MQETDRLRRAAAFYRPPARRPYARAELSFLRWASARGVMDERTGSPWWRAVNDRLLRDKAAADAAGDGAPAPSVRLWREFTAAPSPASWYRAHNASVVAGYLDNLPLAEAELPAERFMMNVALLRVLYAHALVARPRLALGPFARLGPPLGDPRGGSVGFFLDLRSSFPARYPLTGLTAERLIETEGRVARALDYGLIAPRLAGVYGFASRTLGEPRVAGLIHDGAPCYAWPAARRSVWPSGALGLARLVALATGAPAR
ncbi:hypothetical protein [Actinomadura macrotermitis]|uniref:Uncharacterized protein n=1 Tax=Actinomadura macrotermitis TaxID=2585200 RepID=A0A7K0C599_9ACTN|nr:hypothetical protein [Actinomadura macrotermitis]MQY08621.1 hypothetical protein [Actinomadura macrotermitis]